MTSVNQGQILNSALTLLRNGELEDAKIKLHQVVGIKPASIKANFELAKLYFKEMDYENALKYHVEAESISGENKICRIIASKCLIKLGRFVEAEEYLVRSVELEPGSIKYLSILGLYLCEHKSIESGMELFNRIFELSDDLKYKLQISSFLLKEGYYQSAAELLSPHLNELSLKNKQYSLTYGTALFFDGRYEEAVEALQLSLIDNPRDTQLLSKLADCFTGLGQYSRASECYSALAELKPSKTVYQRFRDICLIREGSLSKESKRMKFLSENQYKINKMHNDINFMQQNILEQLLENGFAITSIEDLCEPEELQLWESASKFIQSFRSKDDVADLIDRIKYCDNFDGDPYFSGMFKPSVVRFSDYVSNISADNPCVSLYLSKGILSIANAYNGMLSKIRNVNLWINPVLSGDNLKNRKGSQIWHRDQEDEKILKCFIYYSDVNNDNGATEYVRSSRCAREDKYASVWPYPASSGYPSQQRISKFIDPSDIVSLVGKKGKVAFLDTNGFHRGGFVTKGEDRVLSMATFLRPISPYVNQNTRLEIEGIDTGGWSNEAIFAVS